MIISKLKSVNMKLRNKLKDLNNKLELAIERTTTGGDSKYLI